MKATVANIGIMIATNTVLYTGLDLGQWVADKFSLWMLPANLVAAIIATSLGLALTAAAKAFGIEALEA